MILTSLIIVSVNSQSLPSTVTSPNSTTISSIEDWWWGSIELVSPEFDTNQGYVEMLIDDEDNIHLLMYSTTDLLSSGSDRDVFYKMYDSSSKSWTDLELVTTESTSSSELPQIAIDSSGTIHIIWRDFTDMLGAGSDADIFYKQRTSSGWSAAELVSIDSTSNSVYPAMKIDSNDVLHVAWEDSTDYLGSGTDYDIHYLHRFTNGAWSITEVISDSSTEDANDVGLTVDSQNNIHFVWDDYTNILGAGVDKDIFYRKLNNDLTSWSSVLLISSESTFSGFSPIIDIDTDDSLYVLWTDQTDLDGADSDYDVFHKSYNAKTFSWGTTEVISIESSEDSFSIKSFVDENDYLYIVYQDQTNLGMPMLDNIFFRYLNLKTNTWSTYTVITSEIAGSSQFPRISGDSLGHLYVIWNDFTPDYLGSGVDSDHFMRKFVGIPMVPTLNEIIPDTLPIGNVSLSWTAVKDATSYEIYREGNQFSSIAGLTALASTSSTNYIDELNSTGNYYYAIVAVNDYGKSDMSNIEYVEIYSESKAFFASLDLGETIAFAGIVLGVQLILSLITYILISSKVDSIAKSKKAKKK